MVTRSQRDPKASQEAVVSWAVAAHAVHSGKEADGSVERMSCAVDGVAVAAADAAVANCTDAGAGEVLVDGYVVRMLGAATGGMDETPEAAYSIVHLIEHELVTSAKQDSCHSMIVAVRTVRAAEGQVAEADRWDTHCDIPQAV